MINEARTLLLNQLGPHAEDPTIAGDVVIPAYTPVDNTQPLADIRRVLFGARPDYDGLLYRTAQYMLLLHSTEFSAYLFTEDSRITYDTLATDIAAQQDFGVDITLAQGPTLTVLGSWNPGNFVGRVVTNWRLVGTDSSELTATNLTTGEEIAYDLTASDALVLPGSTLVFSFSGAVGLGDQWRITHRARPEPDLGVVLATLTNMSVTQRTAVFGVLPPTREPDVTYFRLFTTHYALPYQLSGLLLALIARTRELSA